MAGRAREDGSDGFSGDFLPEEEFGGLDTVADEVSGFVDELGPVLT